MFKRVLINFSIFSPQATEKKVHAHKLSSNEVGCPRVGTTDWEGVPEFAFTYVCY